MNVRLKVLRAAAMAALLCIAAIGTTAMAADNGAQAATTLPRKILPPIHQLLLQPPPPTCSDGVKNGSETDRDCGGDCKPCADGLACSSASDCQSGMCNGQVCQAPSCVDNVKNGNETDNDCGGGTCRTCNAGQHCLASSDCSTGLCNPSSQLCELSPCADGVKNGNETDIDCGGGTCPACTPGHACMVNADCLSGICTAMGMCAPPN